MTDTFMANAAEAAFGLLDGGQTSVTCVEIAKAMGYDKSPVLLTAVRHDLLSIRTMLRDDYSLLVMPVNQSFFDCGYNAIPPANMDQAKRCLPGGGGRTYGIKLCNGPSDLVWNAMKIRHGHTGTTWLVHAMEDAPKRLALEQFERMSPKVVQRVLESSKPGQSAVNKIRRQLEQRIAEMAKGLEA